MKKPAPVQPKCCATCPFRKDSPYNYLAAYLAEQALRTASRISHSTGKSVIHGMTGKKRLICRGARNIQLEFFCALGVIEAPTDEAWAKRVAKL